MKASRHLWLGAAAALAIVLWASSAAALTELVMYTQTTCPFCQRFEREIAPVYERTKEGRQAPLRRVELSAGGVRGAGLKEPVFATPTFVLMANGREAGRITGYMNDDMFWGMLGRLLSGIESTADQSQRPVPEKP